MSTALYNRYRPATFGQVVGQEHVTGALMRALSTGRLHHAYLFSGPRGCGKTSSARILAASLNCVDGPTPEPCGVCEQCTAIRTGSSMDVIEIDAASHGLVDDARDLRERAFFAPASARFKVYVVDEAHMVTAAAFNALLKVVEEPPPYLKFVFATTEPDKVIATIRSRTHHYAFRLVPPKALRDHLASICEREQVTVEPAVLPLVVRAGAGSVRDALSVLDQLLAGADTDGLTYDRAAALLGVTDGVLLDQVTDALATRDGAAAFTIVDKVVSSGHDPRRFATDLLDRLRDLIVLAAVPDAPDRGLLTAYSDDQLERMRAQCARMTAAELSWSADVIHNGLVEMRGASSPRLLLELILARALLPGASADPSALLVRLERLERGLGPAVPASAGQSGAAEPPAAGRPADVSGTEPGPVGDVRGGAARARAALNAARVGPAARAHDRSGSPGARPGAPMAGATSPGALTGSAPASSAPMPDAPPTSPPEPSAAAQLASVHAPDPAGARPDPTAPSTPPVPPTVTAPPAPAAAPAAEAASPTQGTGAAAGDTVERVRAHWDAILRAARARRPATPALLSQYATVVDVRSVGADSELVLVFSAPKIAQMFGHGRNMEVLAEALAETVGGSWRVSIGTGGEGGPGGPGAGGAGGSGGGPARPAGPGAVGAPTASSHGARPPSPPVPAGNGDGGPSHAGGQGEPARPPHWASSAGHASSEPDGVRGSAAPTGGARSGPDATPPPQTPQPNRPAGAPADPGPATWPAAVQPPAPQPPAPQPPTAAAPAGVAGPAPASTHAQFSPAPRRSEPGSRPSPGATATAGGTEPAGGGLAAVWPTAAVPPDRVPTVTAPTTAPQAEAGPTGPRPGRPAAPVAHRPAAPVAHRPTAVAPAPVPSPVPAPAPPAAPAPPVALAGPPDYSDIPLGPEPEEDPFDLEQIDDGPDGPRPVTDVVVTGEDAAMNLLRDSLGATVIE